ncbi:hypothetical protein [Corynebacterium pygosceleis]|uniref:hypothetical protein n=1 Tax=Corynebacterium pygosceleis TaxID=2800406 RepID=UPI002004F26F|nr:hypothetical protein [Corynebacterium pygosceleis]MCK7674555.1 hypothetical protein [Corynebacterium pygosceleis]
MDLAPTRALVIGGTGMLLPFSRGLAAAGASVVLPSRHPERLKPTTGLIGVETSWHDPDMYAHRCRSALGGTVDLLVMWCHSPWRRAVADAVTPLLTRETVIIEVLGSSGLTSPDDARAAAAFGDSVLCVLGRRPDRWWLTHREISDGVWEAARRRADVVVGTVG